MFSVWRNKTKRKPLKRRSPSNYPLMSHSLEIKQSDYCPRVGGEGTRVYIYNNVGIILSRGNERARTHKDSH